MEFNITLYRAHDEDLFTVYQKMGGRQMNIYIKDALKAYANNSRPAVRFPDISNGMDGDKNKRSARFHVTINNTEYAKEIAIIEKIKPSFRQIFIKGLLRFYHFNELIPLYGNNLNEITPDTISQQSPAAMTTLLTAILGANPSILAQGTNDEKKPAKKTKPLVKEHTEPEAEPKADDSQELIKQKAEADMDALADMFGL